jgi:hypothetical protein
VNLFPEHAYLCKYNDHSDSTAKTWSRLDFDDGRPSTWSIIPNVRGDVVGRNLCHARRSATK